MDAAIDRAEKGSSGMIQANSGYIFSIPIVGDEIDSIFEATDESEEKEELVEIRGCISSLVTTHSGPGSLIERLSPLSLLVDPATP